MVGAALFASNISTNHRVGLAASALEFGFGFFQYFIRSHRRTIHDRIAETIVVAEPVKKKLPKRKKKKRMSKNKV